MNLRNTPAIIVVMAMVTACGNNSDQSNADTALASQDSSPVTDTLAADCVNGPVSLQAVIDDQRRRQSSRTRDIYRHPMEVLNFFDLQPNHTVIEIWPSGGWWTEIIAPYVRDCGHYVAAGFALDAKRTPGWRKRVQRDYNDWLRSESERFDQVQVTGLSIPERPEIAPGGTADRVLTFRNVHNWMNGNYAPQVFVSMYKALKPGGMLGLVEHRAEPGTSYDQMLASGYVTEAQVITMAEAAGFELLASSKINANPKDSKDYPQGVWSLPPSYRGGEGTREHYRAIGESDRMTLLFRRPE